MNYDEFVAEAAKTAGLSRDNLRKYASVIFDTIVDNMAKGDDVSIPKFGKFKVSEKPARTCRNPKTGETVEVPAKIACKFTPSSVVKDKINE